MNDNHRFTVPVPGRPEQQTSVPQPPPVVVPPAQQPVPPPLQQDNEEDKKPRFDWLLITAVSVLLFAFCVVGISSLLSTGSNKDNQERGATVSSSTKTPSPSGSKTTALARQPSSFLSRVLGTMLSILLLLAFVLILCVIGTILSYFKSDHVQIKGYWRKDGTYVKSHTRKK